VNGGGSQGASHKIRKGKVATLDGIHRVFADKRNATMESVPCNLIKTVMGHLCRTNPLPENRASQMETGTLSGYALLTRPTSPSHLSVMADMCARAFLVRKRET